MSTLITGVLAATFAGLLPIGILGELVSIGTLIAFIVVCIGVLVLRYTRPDLPRPFRVKAVWFTSLMGVIFCAGMAASLPDGTWWRLVLWSVLGIAMYFVYGYRHSRLRLPAANTPRLQFSTGDDLIPCGTAGARTRRSRAGDALSPASAAGVSGPIASRRA